MGSWGHRCGILRRAGAAVGAGTAPGAWRPRPVRNPATGPLEWHQSITAAGGGREAESFEELQLAAHGAGSHLLAGAGAASTPRGAAAIAAEAAAPELERARAAEAAQAERVVPPLAPPPAATPTLSLACTRPAAPQCCPRTQTGPVLHGARELRIMITPVRSRPAAASR